jgi:hypothetical protein
MDPSEIQKHINGIQILLFSLRLWQKQCINLVLELSG